MEFSISECVAYRNTFCNRALFPGESASTAEEMGMLVFVLGSLKWALLCFVLVLGVGKAIARVASWVANNACQGESRGSHDTRRL